MTTTDLLTPAVVGTTRVLREALQRVADVLVESAVTSGAVSLDASISRNSRLPSSSARICSSDLRPRAMRPA